MENLNPQIDASWKDALDAEFRADYFIKLRKFLVEEKKSGKIIYPPGNQIFSAFNYCPFENVKVVLIGQDPYHGAGQAQGLSFSVPEGMRVPPSLLNIFKEIKADLGFEVPKKGDLSFWAKQGILLLNATLTVLASQAGSHQNQGWEIFTDAVIKKLSDEKSGLVFLLWGNFAKAKETLIDVEKHVILKAAHPASEAYGRGGFFGCRHFSKTNEILKQQGKTEIDWTINDLTPA